MNKDYIAEANGNVKPTTQQPVVNKAAAPVQKPTTETPKDRNPYRDSGEDTKLRSMALAYAKDLCVAGKIELTAIPITANGFYTYMISGTLKI